jgi:phosphoglycerol transferase MdoB-like AlkP superfamily enzyme
MSVFPRLPRLLRFTFSVILTLLLLMTLYRFFFFFHYRPANRPFTGSAFLLGLRYDARIVSILGLLMLIFGGFRFLSPFSSNTSRNVWLVILSIVFVVILIFYGGDFYHYDYLKQRLNASVLNFAQDAGISARMMWQTYPLVKILIAFTILVFFFNYVLRKRLDILTADGTPVRNKRRNSLIYTITVLILALAIFGKVDQYPLRWSDAFAFGDDFKASTALNPFQSFFSSLTFRKSGFDLAKVKASYPRIASYLGVPPASAQPLNYKRVVSFPDTFVDKPNIVVVICESFSAYKSSMFGNKLDPTPYFNQLCNKGVFFERCFTPAFGTARGVWAVITGIPDVEDPKTASRNPSAVNQHTIINDFKSYDKFYFLGGSTTWANIRGLLTNNIDGLKIYEEDNFKAKKVDVWGISDKNLFLESARILGEQNKPFFSIIQTADNHRPYTIPAEDQAIFKKVSYPADTLKKYGFDDNGQLNAFRYTDFCFQKFMEAAAREKFFNNTIFVFVGDHGLRGDAGDMFPKSFTKQGILAEHVPLLFYSPGMLPPTRIKEVCSQLDILPSVAALAKQPYLNSSFGRNLFDSTNKGPHYAFIADPDLRNIGLVSNDYYYTQNIQTGRVEFVSVRNNEIVHADSAKKSMGELANDWYQTAKYLLLNNKKEN